MSYYSNASGQGLLLNVIKHCACGYWYSLSKLVGDHKKQNDVLSANQTDPSLGLAILIRDHAQNRLRAINNKAKSKIKGKRVQIHCQILVESAFLHLRLAEQYLLVLEQKKASIHCQLFIRSLIAAAIQLDGNLIGREEEESLLKMSRSLSMYLNSQQQLQLAAASGSLPRQFVVVLGMHRSGTSALTGMLSHAGLDAPADMVNPDPINPRGYWESAGINKINDELLRTFSTSWQDPSLPDNWVESETAHHWRLELLKQIQLVFSSASIPVIKDPRLCILLPGLLPWLECGFIEWHILLPIRHPLEVARSLEAVQSVTIDKGIQLWLQHILIAEKFSRNYRRCILSFDKLIENPRSVLEKIISLLTAYETNPTKDEEASLFVTADLYRQRRNDQTAIINKQTENVETCRNLAIRLYDVLTVNETPNPEEIRSLSSLINLCTI